MLDRSAGHLVDIEEAVSAIDVYLDKVDKESFLGNALLRDAVAMHLIIIGEAAARLSADAKAEATEIPWGDIVGLRNRIVHGYRSVNYDLVWDICDAHLSVLSTAVRRMLAARGE